MLYASLPMYDLKPIQKSYDLLWTHFIKQFPSGMGINLSERLKRSPVPSQLWSNPDMFLSQACGYNLTVTHPNDLKYICTPCYIAPGCKNYYYSSVFIIHKQSPIQEFSDLKNGRAVVNTSDSHSGMNVLRAKAAPFSENGAFFSSIHITGSHYQSMIEIAKKEAEVAAIDCVTFELIKRWQPELIQQLQVLQFSELYPALPFVAGSNTSLEMVQTIFETFKILLNLSKMKELKETLLLDRVEQISTNSYQSILKTTQIPQKYNYFEFEDAFNKNDLN